MDPGQRPLYGVVNEPPMGPNLAVYFKKWPPAHTLQIWILKLSFITYHFILCDFESLNLHKLKRTMWEIGMVDITEPTQLTGVESSCLYMKLDHILVQAKLQTFFF